MAYNESLANRIRENLESQPLVEEKKMMGGLVFMVDGKMCVGIIKDEMMLRIDPTLQEFLLEKIGCRMMDFTKRPMKGYIMVNEDGMKFKKDFSQWIQYAIDFNKHAKLSKKK